MCINLPKVETYSTGLSIAAENPANPSKNVPIDLILTASMIIPKGIH
jgi:hypothetical protein